MAVDPLDDSNFAEKLASSEMAVVDFYPGWCGPCRMFAPRYKRLSAEYGHVRFFKLDGERAPEARRTVQIDNLPYFALYRRGEFVEGLSTGKEDAFRELLDRNFGRKVEA